MKPGANPIAEPDAVLSPTAIARETLTQIAARRMAPTPDNFRDIYNSISGGAQEPDRQLPDPKLADLIKSLPGTKEGLHARKELEQALVRRDWTSARGAILALAEVGGGQARVPDPSPPWAHVLHEVINELEAGHAGWTRARKRLVLDRLLETKADNATLQAQLAALIAAWKESPPSKPLLEAGGANGASAPGVTSEVAESLRECLATALDMALPGLLRHAPDLAREARALAARVREASGAAALAQIGVELHEFIRHTQQHDAGDAPIREALLGLLRLLVDNVEQLAEGDQWIQDQMAVVRAVLKRPLTPQVIDEAKQAISELMAKQTAIRRAVEEAKASLKTLLQDFIERLSEMSEHTDTYQQKLETYSEKLQKTGDLATINEVIRDLIRETRAMKDTTENSRAALANAREHARAAHLRIGQVERELEQLTERVREDQLTGTLNRKGLDEAFQREAARADRQSAVMSVALLDVDNFKSLNDSHGHIAGDKALQHIVAVIREQLRPADTLARFGGEEFVILLPDSKLSEAVEVMARLQRELTKRFFLHNNNKLLITFSCGVAQRSAGEDLEHAVSRADGALYQAKRTGKNRVCAAAT